MEIKLAILMVLLAGLLLLLLFSCKKEAIKVVPNITVATVTNIIRINGDKNLFQVLSEGAYLKIHTHCHA